MIVFNFIRAYAWFIIVVKWSSFYCNSQVFILYRLIFKLWYIQNTLVTGVLLFHEPRLITLFFPMGKESEGWTRAKRPKKKQERKEQIKTHIDYKFDHKQIHKMI